MKSAALPSDAVLDGALIAKVLRRDLGRVAAIVNPRHSTAVIDSSGSRKPDHGLVIVEEGLPAAVESLDGVHINFRCGGAF